MENKKLTVSDSLRLRLQTKRIYNPHTLKGKKVIVCHLEESMYNQLNKLAEFQYMRADGYIDMIVKGFTPEFEDVIYFVKGSYETSFISKMKNYLAKREDRIFVTFKVDLETYTKLDNAKQYFGMSRSMVLKHIIKRKLQESISNVQSR